jgi:hypothetical protein
MNRQDLLIHLKQVTENIDKILDAAQLPTDLQEFTPEQIEALEAIAQLVETKQAKTYKVAGEIYRKPIREIQLEEIAFRHTIAHDRIPEILAEMKLKPETLTDEQLMLFKTVCQQLQAGIAFEMAVQSVAPQKQTKGKKTTAQTMPEFVPPSEPAGAITPTNNGPMPGLAVQTIPDGHSETLQSVVDVAIDTAGFKVNERIANRAINASEALDGAIDNAIWRSLMDPSRANALSAEKVVEAIKRKRAERNGN